MKMVFAVAALVATVVGTAPTNAGWVKANGKACASVCTSGAVSSGTYKNADARLNGQTFFVCRGDAGDGLRAGYNLRPNWSQSCWVGHGGQEKPINPYDCLCK